MSVQAPTALIVEAMQAGNALAEICEGVAVPDQGELERALARWERALAGLGRLREESRPLGPGIYAAADGAMHIDLEDFVIASGGDPESKADCEKALEIIQRAASDHGIPIEER